MIMVNFEFLSEPIHLTEENINVLCIENPELFRKVYNAFIIGETEENDIVFSENFSPIKAKGMVCVVDDFFRLSYSNAIMKKLYEQIERYCNNELQQETIHIKTHLVNFLEQVNASYDYDFDFTYDVSLTELFKVVGFKPSADRSCNLNALLDYIMIINKYAPPKCFVLLNLHLYFSKNELEIFYKDIINNHISLLIVENIKSFDKSDFEKVIIYDKDFCEIVEISQDLL